MSSHRKVEQLAALEWALREVPSLRTGQVMEPLDTWLRQVESRFGEAGVPEIGHVANGRAWLVLVARGPLSCRDDGGRWAYRDREIRAREHLGQLLEELGGARDRLEGRLEPLQRLAESAIRSGAEANLLSAQGGRARGEWLSEVLSLLASHPGSGAHVLQLLLSLPEPDVVTLLDRTFREVFGV